MVKITSKIYIKKIPEQLNRFVDFIPKKVRPDQLSEIPSEKIRKIRRSVSTEPLLYPFRWVIINTAVFRQSIKLFKNNFTAVQYHEHFIV